MSTRHPKRHALRSLRIILAAICCCATGCHGISNGPFDVLQQRFVCPGCHSLSQDSCNCGAGSLSSGYHATRWRSLEPPDLSYSSPTSIVPFTVAPEVFQAENVETRPAAVIEQEKSVREEISLGSPVQDKSRTSPPAVIEQQSHLEPIEKSGESADEDEREKYFFDLDS